MPALSVQLLFLILECASLCYVTEGLRRPDVHSFCVCLICVSVSCDLIDHVSISDL